MISVCRNLAELEIEPRNPRVVWEGVPCKEDIRARVVVDEEAEPGFRVFVEGQIQNSMGEISWVVADARTDFATHALGSALLDLVKERA